jgi:hypothetical protein
LDVVPDPTHCPRTFRTAFTGGDTEAQKLLDQELNRQEENDREVVQTMEKKVEEKISNLKSDMERKLDNFFKTMREAYGVPQFISGHGGGVGSASAGAPPGGAGAAPFEGAKVRFRLPDLPPGKHATIQLQRQLPVPVGSGESAGSQQEALGTVLKRLETVMRKVSDQPSSDVAESPTAARPAPGSLSDLYNKLRMIKDNLDDGPQDAAPTLKEALDQSSQLPAPEERA